MKAPWLFLLGGACGVAVAMLPKAAAHLHAAAVALHGDHEPLAAAGTHTEERFVFTAHAPMEQVAPLFGADKERLWSPKWDPQFIHPLPAADKRGMVFAVAHGHLHSAWVNTQLDLENGRIQYVYMIPDALVTVITLTLKPMGNQTRVEVEYDRTSLAPEADARVHQMAKQDREAGPDWERQINQYLEQHKSS